jgi:hypothetical protein
MAKAKGIWRREGDHAVPVGADSIEYLRSIEEGAEFIAETHGARNIRQLRLFWALVEVVVEATDISKTVVKKDLAISLGFTETWMSPITGKIHIEAKSIAVESMLQSEFDDFMRRAVETMAGWIGCEQRDLMRRYNELAADKRYEGYRR